MENDTLFRALVPVASGHMSFAMAVRFNTTVSAADARLANMSYAQKISEQRLQRSQELSLIHI